MNDIKSIFEDHGSHLKIDADLAKKIKVYHKSFVNKNDDHIQFFGSNLTGVYPVRMTSMDEMEWLVDILGLDPTTIKQEVKALPGINENWVRGTDVYTLSCFWLAHKFYNSKLPIKVKEDAMYDVLMILHFRITSSIMVHYFKFEVDKVVAQMVYDRLSLKFRLKTEGSWYGLLSHRVKDLMSSSSIHHRTIQNFKPTEAIQYMITDVQGRIRDIVKNLWTVLAEVRLESKQSVNRSMIDLDGDLSVRDSMSQLGQYKDYLMNITTEPTAFIKAELLEVVCDTMPTMPAPVFIDAIKLLVVLRTESKSKQKIEELLELTLIHVFEQFAEDRSFQRATKDIYLLLARMRALYTSSRSKGDVLKLRDGWESIIKKYLKPRSHTTTSAVRTGILMYIILRTFLMNRYA